MISLLISLLVVGFVFFVIVWLVNHFIPDPYRQFALVVIAVIAIVYLLSLLNVLPGRLVFQ